MYLADRELIRACLSFVRYVTLELVYNKKNSFLVGQVRMTRELKLSGRTGRTKRCFFRCHRIHLVFLPRFFFVFGSNQRPLDSLSLTPFMAAVNRICAICKEVAQYLLLIRMLDDQTSPEARSRQFVLSSFFWICV